MTGTIYSLIPALLTIALVILTRRVVLSLGVGALSAAFILANFNPLQTLEICSCPWGHHRLYCFIRGSLSLHQCHY